MSLAVANYRGNVYRKTSAGSTSAGQKKRAWTKVGAALECDRQPASGDLVREVFGMVSQVDAVVLFAGGTDARVGDGIEITDYRAEESDPWSPLAAPERWIADEAKDWRPLGALELGVRSTTDTFA